MLKAALMIGVAIPAMGGAASGATWQMVVNNGVVAPQSVTQPKTPYFFSYNQPAINTAGQVVFRARAKPLTLEGQGGGGGEPVRGVYTALGTGGLAGGIRIVADNLGVLVPQPNTTGAQFIEFPSTPRADALSATVATRGQSQPVVTLSDGTKVGTSGVYLRVGGDTTEAAPALVTGASLVGNVPAYSYFSVPTEAPGTKFDQFPGSPSPVAGIAVFKGNYTVDGVGKTGVFLRNTKGGTQPVKLIVKSGMPIPDAPGKVFGSAAPPSAATNTLGVKKVVFAGFDNEEAPTAGGIYITKLADATYLRALAAIGTQVPTMPAGTTFNKFGEGLSFEGRFVTFWGAWGSETKIVHKDCPADGNKDLIAYCLQQYPSGADLPVPVNQGIFLVDVQTSVITLIAKTNADGFTDFLYWTYSGKPPGSSGEAEDAEPPRWRSSAFTAVTTNSMVFKGQKGAVDGLYARNANSSTIIRVLDTTMDGRSVDPAAPIGSLVSAIGVERDGFRGSKVAITASMLNAATTASWAGIYVHDCGATCSSW